MCPLCICFHFIASYDCLGSVARLYGSSAQGTGPIVLTNVLCTGVEQTLLECPGTPLDVGSCNHNDDAGVTCLPGKLLKCAGKDTGVCIFLSTLFSKCVRLLCSYITVYSWYIVYSVLM